MNTEHREEKPLVGWGDIATYLKLSKSAAKNELKSKRIPVFRVRRYVAIYASDLRAALRKDRKPLN